MTAILQWIITYAIVRALISVGIGIVTYGAVIAAITNAISYAKTAYNTLPVEVLQFLAIAGIPEFLGIICGAVIARASLQFVKRLALIGG
ncbi:MAG: DUF2523 domain-containing protein [Acidovorax sp.]|uniref:DUF2523 domain-containing protein n=1 Tax=Acidovorax sp. TaxID=1872122 RepID=UPI0039E51319